MTIRPVILSGGFGTRLWPASRARFPKQFAPILGQESLFCGTLRKVSDRSRFAPPLIISSVEHKFLVLQALEQMGITDATILLEPVGRNTGAAAIVCALAETASDALHLVLPSDHIITDEAAFARAIAAAEGTAKAGNFALFGMTPDHPETGFGYIVPDGPTPFDGVLKIQSFTEKPCSSRAESLIAQGALWNSGIFFYAPQTLVQEAEKLAPAHLALCRKALADGQTIWGCTHLDEAAYKALASEPFDKLIMEKTDRGTVIPCAMGWSDVGSWQAIGDLSPKDTNGNAVTGEAELLDCRDCLVKSMGPTVALIGLRDVTVVATKDAILVAPTPRSQEVKDIVARLQSKGSEIINENTTVLRPWGSYEGLGAGARYQVKHIVVAPGKALSLQKHHHRSEHWVVVAGTALVEVDGAERTVYPNESVYIPIGAKHRLTNPGKLDLHLIEVQSGDYLGEDDIVRFSDVYGR